MTAKNILVVEDDPLVRSYVAAVLESAAITCLQTETGCEALRVLEDAAAPVGLMLIDLTLPDMTGIEVATQAAAVHPHLPIIVMSGHAIDAVGDAMARQSIAGFLRKPFLPEELIDEVRRLLPNDEAPQPASP